MWLSIFLSTASALVSSWFLCCVTILSVPQPAGPPVNVTCNIFINSFGSIAETTMVSWTLTSAEGLKHVIIITSVFHAFIYHTWDNRNIWFVFPKKVVLDIYTCVDLVSHGCIELPLFCIFSKLTPLYIIPPTYSVTVMVSQCTKEEMQLHDAKASRSGWVPDVSVTRLFKSARISWSRLSARMRHHLNPRDPARPTWRFE